MANIYITDGGQANAPDNNVKKDIQPVPRQLANLEAEKGEVVVGDLVGIGIPQSYKIGGKRHSEGGSPLDVEEGSFIFSDTNDMKFKKKQDADILALFGETETKTPAEIAKKYDMNESIKILLDKDSDTLDRETAEMNINNYKEKLGLLALAQEGKKGFPDGVPEIAENVAVKYDINPLVQKVQGIEERQQQQPNDGQYAEGGELEEVKVGKYVKSPTDNDDNYYYFFNPKSGKYYKIPKDQWRAIGTNNINVIEDDDYSDVVSGQTYYIPGKGFVKANSVEWKSIGNENTLPTLDGKYYSDNITHKPSQYGQYILGEVLTGENPNETNQAFRKALSEKLDQVINTDEYNYRKTHDGQDETQNGLRAGSEYEWYHVSSDGHPGKNELSKKHLDDLRESLKNNNLEKIYDNFLYINGLNLRLVEALDNEEMANKLLSNTGTLDHAKGIAKQLSEAGHTELAKEVEKLASGDLKDAVADFQIMHTALAKLNNDKTSIFNGKIFNQAYGAPEENFMKNISKSGAIYGDNTARQINALNWLGSNNIQLKADPHWTPIAPVKSPVYDDTIVSHNNDLPAPYFMQDLNNLGLAAWNRAHVKKYTPWQALLHYEPYRPVFTDFRGAAARSSAQLNNALQTASAFGPEAFLASFNQMAGKAAENIGQFQEYEDRYNTQVDNDARKTNWQGYNNFLGRKATWDTGLYDKYTIANQQYDNAIKQANQQLVNTINNAYTNRAKQYNQNTMFDNYWIDPRNGGMIEFYSDRDTLPVNHQQSFADQISGLLTELRKVDPSITFDDALKAYKYMTDGADDDDMFEYAMKAMMNGRNKKQKKSSING